MVEYLLDPSSVTSAVLMGQTIPQTIAEYFEQRDFTGPVDLAYLEFADGSNNTFDLFLEDRVSIAKFRGIFAFHSW